MIRAMAMVHPNNETMMKISLTVNGHWMYTTINYFNISHSSRPNNCRFVCVQLRWLTSFCTCYSEGPKAPQPVKILTSLIGGFIVYSVSAQ